MNGKQVTISRNPPRHIIGLCESKFQLYLHPSYILLATAIYGLQEGLLKLQLLAQIMYLSCYLLCGTVGKNIVGFLNKISLGRGRPIRVDELEMTVQSARITL